MKKILVLVSFVLVAAGCTPSPPNNNMTANANRAVETKPAVAPSEAEIIAKEKATWDLIKKKDWDGFGKMLASDYIEVRDDGLHDKASTVATVKDFEIADATFADWKMLTVDKDAVVLTYSLTVKATIKGQPAPSGPYRCSAAWVNRNGEWLAIYFQETMAQTAPPPPPSPMASQSPKASTSPTATPAEAGSDVVANEKLVWDALKSGNFNAFSSYLASDFLEVEAEGVYDKTESVKGVSAFDFSKAVLSDWKSVKIDEDAGIVAYAATIPGMKPEKAYHATIWGKRDGKWVAIFHQGTPAGTTASASPSPTKKM